jgi:hypothetical protein
VLRNVYFTKFQALIQYSKIVWGVKRERVNVLRTETRALCLLQGCTKESLADQFVYNIRIKCDFYVPSCNTSLFKRSVMNKGIRLYNKMLTRIKQSDSFRDFRRKLKLFLLDHPFY